jgi:hypothetical protein
MKIKTKLARTLWTFGSIETLMHSGDHNAIASFIKMVNCHEELLEACKTFASGDMHDKNVLDVVQKAIAHAEGK